MPRSIDKTPESTYISTFAGCYKPMSLKDKLLSNMKEAMKSKDSVKLGTVRSVLSAVKNEEIDLKNELKEEEILALVSREIKKRKETKTTTNSEWEPRFENHWSNGCVKKWSL